MVGDMHILHVDDDSNFCDITRDMLSAEMDVSAATSPAETWYILESAAIDCLLFDYEIPKQSGIELLQDVRERHPRLPVILFTDNGSEEIAIQAIRSGVTDYVQKRPTQDQFELLRNRIGIAVHNARRNKRQSPTESYRDLLQRALSATDSYLWEWDLEADDIVRYPQSEPLDGLTADEIGGLHSGFLERIHPDDRDQVAEAIERGIETQTGYHFTCRLKDGTGSYRWIEDYGTVIDDGTRAVGSVTDVTQQKEREQELLDHRSNLERLLEATTELTIAESIEECRDITIQASVEILGFDWCTIATPDGSGEYFKIRAISEEAPMEIGERSFRVTEGIAGEAFQKREANIVNDVVAYLDADPDETEIRAAMTIPLGEAGVFQAAATTKDRFTETDLRHAELLLTVMQSAIARVEQELELQQQNARLDNFASLLSHDLRNPLTVAQGRVDLLAADVDNEHIEPLRSAHARMESMIDELLTLARVGNSVDSSETVDIGELAAKCWQFTSNDAASIAIDTDKKIEANETRLTHRFENLFSNAIDHGGPDVAITVGSLPNGFYIEDDGPGIQVEPPEQIFEHGFSTGDAGVGVGLTIVKQAVDAHDWDVAVTDSETGGARFEITGVD